MLIWFLAHGERMTSAEAGELIGLSRKGACRLLSMLSRVIPLTLDGETWRTMENPDKRILTR